MCLSNQAKILTKLKNQTNMTSKQRRQIYWLQTMNHSSLILFQKHLKLFHDVCVDIEVDNTNASLPAATSLSTSENDFYNSLQDQSQTVFHDNLEWEPLGFDEFSQSPPSIFEPEIITPSITPQMSSNPNMKKYVETCICVGIQEATKKLVCQAAFQKVPYSERINKIEMDKIQLFLNIANMLFLTGKDGHDSLTNILKLLWKYFPICDVSWLPLPHNAAMYQANVLNITNQNSLIRMLPIPKPLHNDIDNHSYCTLQELLGYKVFFPSIKGYCNVKKFIIHFFRVPMYKH